MPLEVVELPEPSQGDAVRARFELAVKQPSLRGIVVTYRFDAKEPVLHKFVQITNTSGKVRCGC